MAGNGRPKAIDIAPKIRKSFIRAIKNNGGTEYLDRLMTDALEKDFISTLNALSKFNPRVSNVNQTSTLQINIDSNVRGWIEGFNSGVQSLENQEALEHIPADTLEITIEDPAEATLEPLQGVKQTDPVG